MTGPAPRPTRLKRRADFLAAARGRRLHGAAFTLQANRRVAPDEGQPGRPAPMRATVPPGARIGFTVTKKVGNAVERNRIRRRLREAVRLGEALSTEPETDYVVVARREALSVPFVRLVADLATLVRKAGDARPKTAGRTTAGRIGEKTGDKTGGRARHTP